MSPEYKYPELATIKTNEIFVEWVYVVRWLTEEQKEVVKIPLKELILKKDRHKLVEKYKNEYQASEVNLVTITK